MTKGTSEITHTLGWGFALRLLYAWLKRVLHWFSQRPNFRQGLVRIWFIVAYSVPIFLRGVSSIRRVETEM